MAVCFEATIPFCLGPIRFSIGNDPALPPDLIEITYDVTLSFGCCFSSLARGFACDFIFVCRLKQQVCDAPAFLRFWVEGWSFPIFRCLRDRRSGLVEGTIWYVTVLLSVAAGIRCFLGHIVRIFQRDNGRMFYFKFGQRNTITVFAESNSQLVYNVLKQEESSRALYLILYSFATPLVFLFTVYNGKGLINRSRLYLLLSRGSVCEEKFTVPRNPPFTVFISLQRKIELFLILTLLKYTSENVLQPLSLRCEYLCTYGKFVSVRTYAE